MLAVLHIFKSCYKIQSTVDPELPDCWADTFAVHWLSSFIHVYVHMYMLIDGRIHMYVPHAFKHLLHFLH